MLRNICKNKKENNDCRYYLQQLDEGIIKPILIYKYEKRKME